MAEENGLGSEPLLREKSKVIAIFSLMLYPTEVRGRRLRCRLGADQFSPHNPHVPEREKATEGSVIESSRAPENGGKYGQAPNRLKATGL